VDARKEKRPATELLADWQQRAVFGEASLRFRQRRYADAIAQWRAYIAAYPEGVLWQQAQASITDTDLIPHEKGPRAQCPSF
jgi:TolA-binding protein